jgi:outer membrane biogenesis lipoprotein LolB
MKLLSSALAGSALLVLSGCVTPQSAANSNPGDNTTAGHDYGWDDRRHRRHGNVEQRGP